MPNALKEFLVKMTNFGNDLDEIIFKEVSEKVDSV